MKLSVSARGAYRLRLLFSGTVACGKGGRICLLNGVRLENVREDGTVPDVILEAGTSVLTVKEDGICPIESLVIEKQDDAISIGAGVSVVEGGRFSEAALYVVAKPFSDDGPCGSGQALARMHTPGRYALYHLHVEKAGLYDVSLRYDNWYPAMDIRDAFSFLISNVGQEIEAVTLKNTTKREDGAHLYATSAPIQLALPRGDLLFQNRVHDENGAEYRLPSCLHRANVQRLPCKRKLPTQFPRRRQRRFVSAARFLIRRKERIFGR